VPTRNDLRTESVCCLLVLDTVTSTPQWIRQPKPRGSKACFRFQVSDPWWRDRRLQTAHDHPFMNCSTRILDADNIWVVPPGPGGRIDSVSTSRMIRAPTGTGTGRPPCGGSSCSSILLLRKGLTMEFCRLHPPAAYCTTAFHR
jgi:hypothetical protein